MQNEQLVPALKMSLKLERPNTALKIIQSNLCVINILLNNINHSYFVALSKQGQSEDLKIVFQNITQTDKEKLLDYVVDWNSNGKHCLAAQVFNTIFFPTR